MSESLLAHLSHDLRNPGTTLVSCLELLRDVVDDPDGIEAVQDAGLALEQLKNAWARVDVLAGHFAPALVELTPLASILAHVSKTHHASCSAPDDVQVPKAFQFILDGLLEATRTPSVEVTVDDTELKICIRDSRGIVEDRDLREHAFEIERQSDMKKVGRYSRFLGLVTARDVARHVGATLVAGEDCLFRLTRAT